MKLSFASTYAIIEVILTTRTYAIWRSNKRIMAVLLSALVASLTIEIVYGWKFLNKLECKQFIHKPRIPVYVTEVI
jgi:hypothetical protein